MPKLAETSPNRSCRNWRKRPQSWIEHAPESASFATSDHIEFTTQHPDVHRIWWKSHNRTGEPFQTLATPAPRSRAHTGVHRAPGTHQPLPRLAESPPSPEHKRDLPALSQHRIPSCHKAGPRGPPGALWVLGGQEGRPLGPGGPVSSFRQDPLSGGAPQEATKYSSVARQATLRCTGLWTDREVAPK